MSGDVPTEKLKPVQLKRFKQVNTLIDKCGASRASRRSASMFAIGKRAYLAYEYLVPFPTSSCQPITEKVCTDLYINVHFLITTVKASWFPVLKNMLYALLVRQGNQQDYFASIRPDAQTTNQVW